MKLSSHRCYTNFLWMKRFISRMATVTPRRFAPLKDGAAANSNAPRLKGIVFDVDGTLWYVTWETLIACVLLQLFICLANSSHPFIGVSRDGTSILAFSLDKQ